MGTWGVGSFENDAALDWCHEFLHEPKVEGIVKPLEIAATSEFEPTGGEQQEAIAAAELVAALLNRNVSRLHKPLAKWASSRTVAPPPQAIELALKALSKIRKESELRDLWMDSEEGEAWLRVIDVVMTELTTS